MIISDLKQRKTCILSLRSGAIIFIMGMSLIQVFLGMLSIWLILQFTITVGLHSYIFMTALKMENDKYFLMPNAIQRRQYDQQRDYELPNDSQPPVHMIGGVPKDVKLEQHRD